MNTFVGTSIASSTTIIRRVFHRIPFAPSFRVRKWIRTHESLFWIYRLRSFTVKVQSSKFSMKSSIYSPIDSVVSWRKAATIISFPGKNDSSIIFSAIVSDFPPCRDQSTTIIFSSASISSFCHSIVTSIECQGILTVYE